MTYAIQAEGLVKRLGKTTALAGVDLTARPGTVLGLLGPNGAGEDNGRPGPRHTAAPGRRARHGRGPTTWCARPTGCAASSA